MARQPCGDSVRATPVTGGSQPQGGAHFPDQARQAFLIAEISNSRTTFSLTRTPPVSSAAFQVMP